MAATVVDEKWLCSVVKVRDKCRGASPTHLPTQPHSDGGAADNTGRLFCGWPTRAVAIHVVRIHLFSEVGAFTRNPDDEQRVVRYGFKSPVGPYQEQLTMPTPAGHKLAHLFPDCQDKNRAPPALSLTTRRR